MKNMAKNENVLMNLYSEPLCPPSLSVAKFSDLVLPTQPECPSLHQG